MLSINNWYAFHHSPIKRNHYNWKGKTLNSDKETFESLYWWILIMSNKVFKLLYIFQFILKIYQKSCSDFNFQWTLKNTVISTKLRPLEIFHLLWHALRNFNFKNWMYYFIQELNIMPKKIRRNNHLRNYHPKNKHLYRGRLKEKPANRDTNTTSGNLMFN